jgi:orotidine-5'-phosphate decarboxylase
MKNLALAERLIVAVDVPPESQRNGPVENASLRLLRFIDGLRDTGVCIKVHSLIRALGYSFIFELRKRELPIFADLKLCDTPSVLANDGELLRRFAPDFLTVMCHARSYAMRSLKIKLPITEVLGVTELTSSTRRRSHRALEREVLCLARQALDGALDGIVCPPVVAEAMRAKLGNQLTINCPNIRLVDTDMLWDDQNPDFAMTPYDAIKAGADRIIVGRPITLNTDPRNTVMRILDEIDKAL